MRKCLFWLSLCVAAMMSVSPAWAVVPDTSVVPPELERWKPWVLFGHEERFCPSRFDDYETPQCRWPSTLSLHLDGSGGSFAQEWTLYVKSWVELPGGAAQWPRDVTVDGQSVPVIFHKESPAVFLEPGKHRIEGAFSWQELPDTLPVPPSSGLVALSVGGKQVTHPSFSQNGRLRLQKEAGELQEADRLDVRVFRLVDDAVPMQITTLLKVTVSGRSREIRMGGVLLEDSIPMRMESPIPTCLDASGDLLLQARPAKFHVTIVSRIDGPVERIGPATAPFGPEIWAFQARTSLRLVQVEGVTPIDPKQTEIPLEWASLSTYTVQRGSVMTLKVLQRGDPDPVPDRVNLKREWWLDFDGRGFTVRDQIDGILSSQWALVMNPPVRLGRVSVDGAEQLITAHGPEKKAGVELRRGEVHLVAESRCEAERGTLPTVGWNHDFQSLSGILNLPPGWRLFWVGGVDVVPGSWFDRWTLLDLFLVFVISLAVTKLWNRRLGFLALGALGLIYHEPDAPQQVWLHLLAAVALLRVLPEGRIRRLVSLYRWGAVVGLVVFAIPFMVQQVRVGIYPQLENVYESPGRGVGPYWA
ncbi:MAG: hypothetical protein GX443_15975 [Deltaproteobacteria bacterium]|nr:hypothetical protein [Deltaproteobacteria bacterium]